jgi:hypothetical protein
VPSEFCYSLQLRQCSRTNSSKHQHATLTTTTVTIPQLHSYSTFQNDVLWPTCKDSSPAPTKKSFANPVVCQERQQSHPKEVQRRWDFSRPDKNYHAFTSFRLQQHKIRLQPGSHPRSTIAEALNTWRTLYLVLFTKL